MRTIRLKRGAPDGLKRAFLDELNEAQRAAATAPDGFNLILAGPGSGKTRVITYRVAYLIASGVAPESILLVTFTRRAAREMVLRLEGLIGPPATQVWAGTFHHVGNRLLRRKATCDALGYAPNFTILDSEDAQDLLKLAMADADLAAGKGSPVRVAAVHHVLSYAFNTSRPLDEVVASEEPGLVPFLPQIEAAARMYASRKRAANAMDYDDLLGQWARLVKEFPAFREQLGKQFRHLLVDEMQDTNAVQIELIEAIAKSGAGNLTAVGDDAQSIYRFRGANYDNILKFPERNPGARVFKLEMNYRSTPEIVAFTNDSIAQNTEGFPKHLVSTRPSGAKPLVVTAANAHEESDVVCQMIQEAVEQGGSLSQTAVLYRNHHDSIVLQGDLVARGIRYQVRSGLRFFEQAHIKDVLSYLRVIANPRDEAAWRRLLLLLPGIGPAKGGSIVASIVATDDPLAALAAGSTMDLVPTKSKGPFAAFVADIRRVQKSVPDENPALGIAAVMQGGYPATVRTKYEHPEQRLRDLEQLGVLAARYDSLERFLAELLLAGDIYGMDTIEADDEPGDSLVLSTVHQAKGLEWSRVFAIRLIEDSFPNARGLMETGGEDEERRIFYVAVTRAKDELILTYPLTVSRGFRGPVIITKPSRFIEEVDPDLYETAQVESDLNFW